MNFSYRFVLSSVLAEKIATLNILCGLKIIFHISFPQGFTPDRLSASCCHTVPDFHLSSPAKNFFKKAAAALFGGKKDKARYFDTHSKWIVAILETYLYAISAVLVMYNYEIPMEHLCLSQSFPGLVLIPLSIGINGRLPPTQTYISKSFLLAY